MTTTSTTAGTPDRVAAGRWEYREHLDGVRAVAVLLVVLFHAEAPGFGGGFVGVDVFFVLSGFVVTGSLLAEHARTGRIALPSFYARRVRRLLPAASVLLLSLVVGMRVLASPFERLQAAGDLAAASLYSANWWFVAQSSDYFGADGAESPVLHFWSLAVEEQFYVVWPVLLLLLLPRALGRGRCRGRTMVVIGVAATVSLAVAVATPDASLLTAYYGTHTRIYQLFAGALLALAAVDGRLRWIPRSVAAPGAVAALTGLVVVSSDVVPLDAVDRGVAAAVLTALLVVTTEVSADGPVGSLLRTAPAQRLGARSYAVYLWHWPVSLVVLRRELAGPRVAWLVVLGAAVAAAVASDRLVEGPARRLDVDRIGPGRVVVAGLCVSAVVAALAMVVVPPGDASTAVDWAAATEDLSRNHDCVGEPAATCRVVEGRTPGIVLVGDSHASHWRPALEAIARRTGLALDVSTIGACAWADVTLDRGSIRGDCGAVRDDGIERLAAGADLVLLSSRAMYLRALLVDGTTVEPSDPRHLERVLEGAAASLARLEGSGAVVAVLGPAPEPPGSIPSCLSQATDLDECDFARRASFPDRVAALRRVVEEAGAAWVPTDEVVCPEAVCRAVVDGVVGWADTNHLTTAHAAMLDARLQAALAPVWVPSD